MKVEIQAVSVVVFALLGHASAHEWEEVRDNEKGDGVKISSPYFFRRPIFLSLYRPQNDNDVDTKPLVQASNRFVDTVKAQNAILARFLQEADAETNDTHVQGPSETADKSNNGIVARRAGHLHAFPRINDKTFLYLERSDDDSKQHVQESRKSAAKGYFTDDDAWRASKADARPDTFVEIDLYDDDDVPSNQSISKNNTTDSWEATEGNDGIIIIASDREDSDPKQAEGSLNQSLFEIQNRKFSFKNAFENNRIDDEETSDGKHSKLQQDKPLSQYNNVENGFGLKVMPDNDEVRMRETSSRDTRKRQPYQSTENWYLKMLLLKALFDKVNSATVNASDSKERYDEDGRGEEPEPPMNRLQNSLFVMKSNSKGLETDQDGKENRNDTKESDDQSKSVLIVIDTGKEATTEDNNSTPLVEEEPNQMFNLKNGVLVVRTIGDNLKSSTGDDVKFPCDMGGSIEEVEQPSQQVENFVFAPKNFNVNVKEDDEAKVQKDNRSRKISLMLKAFLQKVMKYNAAHPVDKSQTDLERDGRRLALHIARGREDENTFSVESPGNSDTVDDNTVGTDREDDGKENRVTFNFIGPVRKSGQLFAENSPRNADTFNGFVTAENRQESEKLRRLKQRLEVPEEETEIVDQFRGTLTRSVKMATRGDPDSSLNQETDGAVETPLVSTPEENPGNVGISGLARIVKYLQAAGMEMRNKSPVDENSQLKASSGNGLKAEEGGFFIDLGPVFKKIK